MVEIDHSGLGAAYLRSHRDIPIAHDPKQPCGFCAALPEPEPPYPDGPTLDDLRVIALGLTAAVAVLLGDAAALVLVIGHGAARELNPIVQALPQSAALWGKAAGIVLLALCAVVITRSTRQRRLRLAALRGVLLVAIGAGSRGVVSTVGAAW